MFVVVELAPCCYWLRYESPQNLAFIAGFAIVLVDAIILTSLLGFLTQACLAFRQVSPSPMPDVRGVTASSMPKRGLFRSAPPNAGTRWGGMVAHAWRLLSVAPLRHTASVVICCTVLLATTIVVVILSVLARRALDALLLAAIPLFDDWVNNLDGNNQPPPPFPPFIASDVGRLLLQASPPPPPPPPPPSPFGPDIDPQEAIDLARGFGEAGLRMTKEVMDSILDSLIPASLSALAILVLCFKRSFDLIWQDHVRIAQRWPISDAPMVRESDEFDPWPHLWVGGGEQAARPTEAPAEASSVADSYTPPPATEPPAASSVVAQPAAGSSYVAAAAGGKSPEAPSVNSGRFEDGTLDIVGSFQYLNAAAYGACARGQLGRFRAQEPHLLLRL